MLEGVSTISFSPIARGLGQAWEQCARELGMLIPPPLKEQFSRDPVELDLRLRGDMSGVVAFEAGQSRPVDGTELKQILRRHGALASATLSVPLSRCFVREMVLPLEASRDAEPIMRLDMLRTMPFEDQETLTACVLLPAEPGSPTVVARQFILKRSVIAAAMDEVADAGIPLRAIYVIDEDGTRLEANLLDPASRKRAPATRLVGLVLRYGALLLACLVVAAFVTTLRTLDARIEALETEVQQATATAKSSRAKLSELEATSTQLRQPRLRKLATVSAVALWDEVSRLLPDNTWISDYRMDEDVLQIDGHSPNSSELIGALSKSPLISGAAFASPVTRDPQRGVERFQIKLQIARVEAGAAKPTGRDAK